LNEGIDSRKAWRVTIAATIIASVALGAPYIVIVALKPVAADFGGYRSIPSAAASLAMLGTGVGGLLMSWLAERVGVRSVVTIGGLMVCAGLALSSAGSGSEVWQIYVGHGVLVGLIGNAAIHAPLYVYVSRWFERRRGAALALIASGQYVAGACWPPLFEHAITAYGWRQTMVGFGGVVAALVALLAIGFLSPAPEPSRLEHQTSSGGDSGKVLGLQSNSAFALLATAAFLCCVPMAMPSSHLIALCGDVGLSPAKGAGMLSVLLVCAFISRQIWGWISDRIGGLTTVLVGSLAQATAITGFVATQDEIGLLTVSAAFGLGFSGLIPAYMLTARQLFPAHQASWRIPTLILTGMAGMAAGSWLAGLLYDYFGFYAPAFAMGFAFNLANLTIVASLLLRQKRLQSQPRPIETSGAV
jgi:MFS family permease